MIDIIKVKATNDAGRVAIWEKHPSHPNGEVFVSGNGKTVEVANTVAVRNAIRTGALVEVQPEKAKAPVVEPKAPEQPPVEPVQETPPSAAIRQEGSKTTKR